MLTPAQQVEIERKRELQQLRQELAEARAWAALWKRAAHRNRSKFLVTLDELGHFIRRQMNYRWRGK